MELKFSTSPRVGAASTSITKNRNEPAMIEIKFMSLSRARSGSAEDLEFADIAIAVRGGKITHIAIGCRVVDRHAGQHTLRGRGGDRVEIHHPAAEISG